MIDALGELPSRCVLRQKEFHRNSAGTLRAITNTSVPLVKKVRGSHRSDLTTVRNCAIVRSVAIALLAKQAFKQCIYRASYEHVRKLTNTVVNCS